MSYNFDFNLEPGQDIETVINQAIEHYLTSPDQPGEVALEDFEWWPKEEVRDHLETAAVALITLADPWRADSHLRFSIIGHANTGHVTTPGYSDEFISIRVAVVPSTSIILNSSVRAVV